MDCFKNINSELKNENKKYNLDFYIKNNEAILKYNVPIQTGKNISFELLFKKEEKNKDLIIAKLKERVRDLEEGYFAVEKVYDNEIQNEICQTFKKIRNDLNKKELELCKKFEELRKKSKIENIRLYNKNVFINEITDIMNDISLSDRFYFQWKNGPNYSLDENNTIATKISGGECSNCTILGDRILPKNSIISWKIKIKKSVGNCEMSIGICPENLDQSENNNHHNCWSFYCQNSNLFLKSGDYTPYKKGQLKTNDILEVEVDTINGILSFRLNGEDYGVACENIPDDNLCPVVCMYNEGLSIELIEININYNFKYKP